MSDGPAADGAGARAPSVVLAVLLGAAAVGALARSVTAARSTRLAAVVVAGVLVWLATAGVQRRAWALGSAFLLGLFWLWASVALGLQQRFGAGEAALWIAWSVGVVVASVRARDLPTGAGGRTSDGSGEAVDA